MNKTLQDSLIMMLRHADEMEHLILSEVLRDKLPDKAHKPDDMVREIWIQPDPDVKVHVYKLMGQTVCTVKHSFVVDEDGLARILVERV